MVFAVHVGKVFPHFSYVFLFLCVFKFGQYVASEASDAALNSLVREYFKMRAMENCGFGSF